MARTLTEELTAGVRSLVASRLGLSFPSNRTRELEQGLKDAAREAGSESVEAFARRLLASTLAPADLQRLGRHLTIGETYFFRDGALFHDLENRVLPELIRARTETTRSLRVWSAGCSTGEEAYSMAMLIARLLPDQSSWKLSIVGSDLNPLAVLAAERGMYGEWSFRGTPDWLRSRYFLPAGRAIHQIVPWLRERVTFKVHNLIEDPFPAGGGSGGVDLVLCRNVLMYFTPAQARRTVQRFRAVLSRDGWLVPSPFEAASDLFAGLKRDGSAGVLMYRHAAPAATTESVPTADPGRRPRLATVPLGGRWSHARAPRPARQRLAPPARDPVRVETRAVAGDPTALVREAKAEADRGNADRAAELCAAAVAANKVDPAYRYLLATIELERGRGEEAARALSEAIYLDPTFVMAHIALANLRCAQRRVSEARRAYATALALLDARPPHDEVERSEGLTALDLAELVRAAMSELETPEPSGRAAAGATA